MLILERFPMVPNCYNSMCCNFLIWYSGPLVLYVIDDRCHRKFVKHKHAVLN